MSYFENRINNPEDYKNDYASDALHILERALYEQKESLKYYDMSEKANNETEHEIYWKCCYEHDHKSRGLLMAYEMITCREVINIAPAIRDEIYYVKDILS